MSRKELGERRLRSKLHPDRKRLRWREKYWSRGGEEGKSLNCRTGEKCRQEGKRGNIWGGEGKQVKGRKSTKKKKGGVLRGDTTPGGL